MTALSVEQARLFGAITQELRRETALAYIKNGYENKTKAYLEACEKIGRSPSKNPETSASEMLSYPNVLAFIDSVKIRAAEEAQIDANWLLQECKKIHELDILDIVKDDLSGFKSLNDWPKIWRTSISGYDMQTITGSDDMEMITKKIKWPDKTKNLEMIGRNVLVRAWDKDNKDEDEKGEELTINFNVSEPVSDVKITRGKPKSE